MKKAVVTILAGISLVAFFFYVFRQPNLHTAENWNEVTRIGFENPTLEISDVDGPTDELRIGQATEVVFRADVVSDNLEALEFFAVPSGLFQVVVMDKTKTTVLWKAAPAEIEISSDKKVSFDLPIRLRGSTPNGKCHIQIQFYHQTVTEQEIMIRE